jgi:hypothetical protein
MERRQKPSVRTMKATVTLEGRGGEAPGSVRLSEASVSFDEPSSATLIASSTISCKDIALSRGILSSAVIEGTIECNWDPYGGYYSKECL